MIHTGRSLSTRYTLPVPFAARTMVVVWIEIGFPNPSPFPSAYKGCRFSLQANSPVSGRRKELTHDARDENIPSNTVLLALFDYSAIPLESLIKMLCVSVSCEDLSRKQLTASAGLIPVRWDF